jgi:eukaryotic-like serine/threonine-protein kinase
MSDIEADAMAPGTDAPASALDFSGLTEFQRGPRAAPDTGLEPGTRLGDLTIVRLVGEGGMGRVYEALQGMPCRTVAVKVMRAGVLSAVAEKRFVHEAQILGRLTHPGIARIYSVGMERIGGDTVPYFVMEYVDEALPITTYATRHSLSVRDRVRLFREAAAAIAHGHHKGIIHRDLKPGNILVDAAGRPKIIDFGVARSVERDAALTTMHTRADQLVGTLQYMSPEQFDGSADDLDVRADVYSLGLVLHELLAGRPPYDFTSRSFYEVARVVEAFDPHAISTGGGRRRGDLDLIVTKCLERDRGRRYSSAAELEADVGRHLGGEPIAASPQRLLDTLVRLARRHRLAATATAAIAAAIVAAIVGITTFAVHAERQRLRAIEERVTADRERARADAEADAARRRLYVANMRSLQSCLESRNRRTALQRYDDCLPPSGAPWPLELHCLAPQLDDALFARNLGHGPIKGLWAEPGGEMLTASKTEREEKRTRQAEESVYRGPRDAQRRIPRWHPDTTRLIFSTSSRDLRGGLPVAIDGRPIRRGRFFEEAATDQPTRPLAVSPDGRLVAAYLPDGRVRIGVKATDATQAVLDGHRGRLTAATFSPDGRRLATLGADFTLALWDTTDGRLVLRWATQVPTLNTCMFSPDGSRFAIVESRRGAARVTVVDVDDGGRLAEFDLAPPAAVEDPIVVFAPDGRHLAFTSNEHDLHLYDMAERRAVARLRGHTAVLHAVDFSEDGRHLATGAANGNIRVWDTDSRTCRRELIGHDETVTALAFCPGGHAVYSGSVDGTVRAWSYEGEESLATLPGVRGIAAVAFRPDGRQLAVAARNRGGVELWDPRTVRPLRSLRGAEGTVSHVAYSPDGSLVAAAVTRPGADGRVVVWRTDSGEMVETLGDHGGGATTVAFSGDGSRIATTSRDCMAMVWDTATGRRLVQVTAGALRSSTPIAAGFGLGGERIAYKSREIVDITTGKAAATLPPQGQMACLTVSPDGTRLAAGMATGRVYVSDFATGRREAWLRGHDDGVLDAAFSPDGALIATASRDGTARTWDARTGALEHVFRGHDGSVEFVAFTGDGRRLVTAATDGTVRVWDLNLGEELCRLPGQPDAPAALALAPDGTGLVSGSPQGMVRIWGLSNADVVRARLDGAEAAITAAPPAHAEAGPAAARDVEVPRATPGTPPGPRDPAG